MGLDMSLYKHKGCISIDEARNIWEDNYNEFEDIGYWRKANAIHKWFVDNVQDGNDDCGIYEVSKEKLEQLKNICQEVLDKSIIVEGKVINGQKLVDGKWVKQYEDGKIISNPEIAKKLLPTQSGFFFGGTSYDEYYIEDLESAVEILDRILNTTDFFKEQVYYHASW